jgi:hypothetical protein
VTSASTTSGTTVSSASDTSTDTDPGCPPGEAGCLCEVGSTCEGDLECVEGTCVDPGAACTDSDDEPNGSLEEATDLQSVECGGDPGEAMGVVAGVDVDVYTFGRTIGFCVGEDPDVEVTADNDLDVCVYVDCPGDAMGTVTCADGEAGEMNSMPGCCGQNRARFEDFGCGIGVIADPSHVIVVGPATAGACVEYELSYRLN